MPIFGRCFMNCKADFSRYFFPIIFILLRWQRIFCFFPDCFPRHIILKHATAVYAKHRQVLANTERSFYENFRFCETNSFDEKGDSPLNIVFRYQKLSNTKRAPHEFFLEQKILDNFLWYPFLRFTKIFPPNKWAASETLGNTGNIQKYKNGPLINFSLLWDKKFSSLFGDTLRWFTEGFVPDTWTASTFTCSQLFLVFILNFSSRKLVYGSGFFRKFKKVTLTSCCKFSSLLYNT